MVPSAPIVVVAAVLAVFASVVEAFGDDIASEALERILPPPPPAEAVLGFLPAVAERRLFSSMWLRDD